MGKTLKCFLFTMLEFAFDKEDLERLDFLLIFCRHCFLVGI